MTIPDMSKLKMAAFLASLFVTALRVSVLEAMGGTSEGVAPAEEDETSVPPPPAAADDDDNEDDVAAAVSPSSTVSLNTEKVARGGNREALRMEKEPRKSSEERRDRKEKIAGA